MHFHLISLRAAQDDWRRSFGFLAPVWSRMMVNIIQTIIKMKISVVTSIKTKLSEMGPKNLNARQLWSSFWRSQQKLFLFVLNAS